MDNYRRTIVRPLIIGLMLLLATANAQIPTPIVQVGTSLELGTFLTDVYGRTLYASSQDTHETSACYGSCADVWQPVMVDRVFSTGQGADEALLGMISRRDSYTRQLTYAGQPLYTFVGDYEQGHHSGQDLETFGSLWEVVSPSANDPLGSTYANHGTR